MFLIRDVFVGAVVMTKKYLSELFAFLKVDFNVLNFIFLFLVSAQEKGSQMWQCFDQFITDEENFADDFTIVGNERWHWEFKIAFFHGFEGSLQ